MSASGVLRRRCGRILPALLDDVLGGRNPGRVFDFETDLAGVAEANAAMAQRRAIKSLLRIASV
jgi:uncharacterized protein YerC